MEAKKNTLTTTESYHSLAYTPLVIDSAPRRRPACRRILLPAIAAVVLALVINVVCLLIAKTKFAEGTGTFTSIIILFTGSCSQSKKIKLWTHLFINVLSSLILAASNQGMQILAAPSRHEIDHAHARGRWLRIGVPNLRNLTCISKRRALLWLVLGLSSIPIHLFYNSVVFDVTVANDYSVKLINPDYLNGAQLGAQCSSDTQTAIIEEIQNQTLTFQKLSNVDCIKTYSQQFLSMYADVFLVTTDHADASNESYFNEEDISIELSVQPFSWICEKANHPGARTCDVNSVVAGASTWTWLGEPNACTDDSGGQLDYAIDYCLAEQTEPQCEIGLNMSILILVIVLNAFKLLCLIITAFILSNIPLLTLGDAIDSFLTEPDPCTEGHCLLSAAEVESDRWRRSLPGSSTYHSSDSMLRFKQTRKLWGSAASISRWVLTSILCIVMWVACLILLLTGLRSWQDNTNLNGIHGFSAIASYGFAPINPKSMVNIATSSLTANVLIANLPQLLVSCLYLMYNGLFTSMLLGAEWAGYAIFTKKAPRSLRVSNPRGQQRRAYYLQLPFRYATPLLVASITLHWLISQSIYIALVRIHDYSNEAAPFYDYGLAINGLAWSPLALVLALIIGGLMIVVLWTVALLCRYPAGMPVVGSNSAAISAGCHPREDEQDGFATMKLAYGVVAVGEDGVGHASFSALPVQPLQDGQVYR